MPASLQSVTVTKGIIFTDAFSYCSSLTEITISNDVTAIEKRALIGCNNLKILSIPFVGASNRDETNYSHLGYIFGSTVGFNSQNIPDTLKTVIVTGGNTVSSSAFSGCKSIENISLPSTVTSIGSEAFSGCRSLLSLILPDGVKSISWNAFYNCVSLESIVIPDSIENIHYQRVFEGCISLREASLPGIAISYIPKTNLESIEITSGEIDSSAFNGCSKLENISIRDAVSSIGNNAFLNTAYYNNSSNWVDGVLYIDNCLIKANKNELSASYIIKQGVTLIADSAFYECTVLENIEIPKSVISIGGYAFYNCRNLKAVDIPEGVAIIAYSTIMKSIRHVAQEEAVQKSLMNMH